MRKIKHLISLCIFASLMIFSVGVDAQTTTSTIEGTVTDSNGAAIAGAQVKVKGDTVGTERTVIADGQGVYRIVALPAGNYTLEFSHTGFATRASKIELTLNRTAVYNVALKVGDITNVVDVTSDVPLVDESISSTGSTITPKQIQELPVNGRDYLDLLQLVPGTAVNRQSDPKGDNANPILGERSGNNNFLIDGHSNKDTVNGGPAAQFNQETIAEFQVLTTGFKAEFGQASGAVVNVITKSGSNEYHGVASLFHRNDAFDSSNALTAGQDAPALKRYDYSFAFGGPLINPGFGEGTEFFKPLKDKVFFFGSVERITEDRTLDFEYPNLGTTAGAQTVLGILRAQEDPFNLPSINRETRAFFKLNEQLGRHSLSQEINYTNGLVNDFLPFGSTSLPSSRDNFGNRRLLVAASDTVLLGDQGNPFILTLRGAYRSEPSSTEPSHPDGGPFTRFNGFSSTNCTGCFPFFGDLPQVTFGNSNTYSSTHQKYTTLSASGNKLFGNHDIKFGWNLMRTKVDGTVPRIQQNQTFNTVDDFLKFGPVNAGIFLLLDQGGVTQADGELHLKNDYNALWIQDDWKIYNRLTVNAGVRWDYDSEFKAKKNFSPRLGAAWAIDDKTVVRGNFGIFYDQFRLGLASRVPEFGGADVRTGQSLYFPRGFYGSPSYVSSIAVAVGLPGGCFSNTLTDAQITATNAKCPLGLPTFIGVDRLNRVVAPGSAPIPANSVINISNIQALSGLTPAQYLVQAAAAIGQAPGYFEWGAFGVLANPIIPAAPIPTRVADVFKTPNTMGFSVGFKRELTNDLAIEADYHHKDIRNILGVRKSNLSYATRVAGNGIQRIDPNTSEQLLTFGPFYEGKYDAVVIALNKRLSNRYMFGASYSYSKATDNVVGINSGPSDSFVGTVPLVTEKATGKTNANGPFTSTNGNPVAQAGTFSNGPDLDKGDSGLALDHIFQVNGLVNLPWQIQLSGIFRVQSGFRYSQSPVNLADPDGDGSFVGRDIIAGRNAFTAPAFVNLDMRFAKTFNLGERVKAQFLFEFFNVLNRQNPGSVSNTNPALNPVVPLGTVTQVLPGREGQVGFRLEF